MKKEELNAVRRLQAALRQEQARLQHLQDWSLRITPTLDGLPRATGYKTSSIESIAVQIVACKAKITELQCQIPECQARLLADIDSAIENVDVKDVIAERYVFGLDYQVIASKLHFSDSKVFHLHRQGVKRLMDREDASKNGYI